LSIEYKRTERLIKEKYLEIKSHINEYVILTLKLYFLKKKKKKKKNIYIYIYIYIKNISKILIFILYKYKDPHIIH